MPDNRRFKGRSPFLSALFGALGGDIGLNPELFQDIPEGYIGTGEEIPTTTRINPAQPVKANNWFAKPAANQMNVNYGLGQLQAQNQAALGLRTREAGIPIEVKLQQELAEQARRDELARLSQVVPAINENEISQAVRQARALAEPNAYASGLTTFMTNLGAKGIHPRLAEPFGDKVSSTIFANEQISAEGETAKRQQEAELNEENLSQFRVNAPIRTALGDTELRTKFEAAQGARIRQPFINKALEYDARVHPTLAEEQRLLNRTRPVGEGQTFMDLITKAPVIAGPPKPDGFDQLRQLQALSGKGGYTAPVVTQQPSTIAPAPAAMTPASDFIEVIVDGRKLRINKSTLQPQY
jgi:hypothetical protein